MHTDAVSIDPERLIERLEPELSPGARILRREYGISGYRCDRSGVQGQLPLFVLQPRQCSDVQAVCRLVTSLCAENGGDPPVVLVPRGGGTGLCGGAVPLQPSIVLDMSYMDLYAKTHDDSRYYFVQAGVTIERLNDEVGRGCLFFPGIPVGASRDATLGGVISTNARGLYALKYGNAGDSIARIDIVLADGTYVELGPHAIETTAGVNLAPLMIGAEGTMGIILGAVVRLSPMPTGIKSVFLTFDEPYDAFYVCQVLRRASPEIAAVELLPQDTLRLIAKAMPGAGVPTDKTMVWIEIHSNEYYEDKIDVSWLDGLDDDWGDPIYQEWTPPEVVNPWNILRDLSKVIATATACAEVLTICPAVPVGRLREYMQGDIQKRLGEIGRRHCTSIVCDAGVGVCRIQLAIGGSRRWSRVKAEEFKEWALDRARYWGGTASGMYGFGSMLVDRMVAEKPKTISILRSVKRLFDPNGILNPGKLIDWPAGPTLTSD